MEKDVFYDFAEKSNLTFLEKRKSGENLDNFDEEENFLRKQLCAMKNMIINYEV